MKKLKEKGYSLWLDDFGSGYSSLNVLKEYVHNDEEKKEYYDMLVEDSPIKRLVTTKEIAKLIRYLISNDASFINGVVIPIDGGYSI